jgi:hypothetical protein
MESILRDLQGLPLKKLVEVARYVHSISETAREERTAVLRETHGYMNAEEGRIFEEAVATARQLEAKA